MTTQSLQRSSEPVWVLRRVCVSGPITALAVIARLQLSRKVTIFRQQALTVNAGRVRKDLIGL